jgi:Skp family chaperone for outer membrane proteins
MNVVQNKWVIIGAIGAFALIAISAFQAQPVKMGTVNLAVVADKSKLGIREKQQFEALRTKLSSMLQFMNNNKVMTLEQGAKLRELWVTENPTGAQIQELEKLKNTIQNASEELRRLLTETQPDEAKISRIRELTRLVNQTDDILPELDQQYTMLMRQKAEEKQQSVIEKARTAVQKIGKRDGYTVIFESNVAPYAANDITDEAVKSMDQDNP